MLRVRYQKLVPYSYAVVLSQYYDYEHIAHVHPDTLGEYRLVSVDDDVVVYEQIWPRHWGRRRTSLVEQRFVPPDLIRFSFRKGLHRGVVVDTRLIETEDGTLVDETYSIPWVPDWAWLRALARPSIVKRVDEIWDEDIGVDVCHGGWPGVPVGLAARVLETVTEAKRDGGLSQSWDVVCHESEVPETGLRAFRVGARDQEMALGRVDGKVVAIDSRCPHSGGPLVIGDVESGAVTCPWHGARFDLATGHCLRGPGDGGVASYVVRERDGQIEVRFESAKSS